jgi:hypothetical protein
VQLHAETGITGQVNCAFCSPHSSLAFFAWLAVPTALSKIKELGVNPEKVFPHIV